MGDIITRTAQYAIQALVYLAEAEHDHPVTVAQIARGTRVPRNYLSKVLNALVQVGILDSTRGPRGGFRLVGPATGIFIADVSAPFSRPPVGHCLLYARACPRGRKCPCREECRGLSDAIDQFLATTSIDHLTIRRIVDVGIDVGE